ncbi:OmpH family outer membrane protein [Actomonas aquatica]|uniref:OmpH family outer membrane protein n=1 Tax=Actomonas aquatica TaxID=2866162 RepID=A0ABZ1CBF0_9BACT|nr:OmpH family outer membrane protein [Opitutus sp. WL0086]WRQ87630.1 OmpH family outer membrane protein [Opitutus sp. WL0086]
MKNHLKSLFAVLAFAAVAATGFAQAPKIAIVDMAYLFDNHYRTVEQNAVFKGEQERVKAEIDRLNGEGLALQQEAQSIAEQLNNPVLSDDAKAKIEDEARAKVGELQRKQNEMNQLVNNSTESLRKRVMNFRSLLLEEISKVAVEVAKRQGATLLLDKSGPSVLGMPSVLYNDDSLEITEAVLAEINKDKPADSAVTSDANSGETPTVSFPGAN